MVNSSQPDEQRLLTTLELDYQSFKRTFIKKKKLAWARPSIWYDADTADTVDRTQSEDAAILNVLDHSRLVFKHRTDVFTPTDRMAETKTAAVYAYANSINIVRFLMWVLILSDEHARRMLQLSGWKHPDVAKTEPQLVIPIRQKRIDERLIIRAMMGMRKSCPGKHHNPSCDRVTTANHDLCWSCHQVWKTRDEMEAWMLAIVRNDRQEFRRQAIESLYFVELPDESAYDDAIAA